MPAMKLIWKRVYTAIATASWSVLAAIIIVHFMGSWLLLGVLDENDLTNHAATWFYYYVVTATTVGYGDLSPATDAGRVLSAIFVVPGAIAIFTAVLGKAITDISSFLRRSHMGMGNFSKRKDHIVVVGWQGERTRRLIEDMLDDCKKNGRESEQPVLMCASKTENPMPNEASFIAVETISDTDGLIRAGATNARTIVIRGKNDDETLAATLAAQACAPHSHIVAYFEDEKAARLINAQNGNVETVVSVSSDIIVRAACDPGSSALARLMFSGNTEDTAYSISVPEGGQYSFIDLMLGMKIQHGITVIGLKSENEAIVDLNCSSEREVLAGDIVYYISDHRLPANMDWSTLKKSPETVS